VANTPWSCRRTGWPWQYAEWWLGLILVIWGAWLLTHPYTTWDAPGGPFGPLGERIPLGALTLVCGLATLTFGYVPYYRGLVVAQTLALFVWAVSGLAVWQASGGVATAIPFLLTLWPWQVSVLAGTLTRVRLAGGTHGANVGVAGGA
jgi:hypothetical protein